MDLFEEWEIENKKSPAGRSAQSQTANRTYGQKVEPKSTSKPGQGNVPREIPKLPQYRQNISKDSPQITPVRPNNVPSDLSLILGIDDESLAINSQGNINKFEQPGITLSGSSAPSQLGSASDIFSLRRADFQLPDTSLSNCISKVAVANNLLVLSMQNQKVYMWRTDQKEELEEIEVGHRPEDSVYGLFLSPFGYHLVIALASGECHYLHTGAPKGTQALRARKLQKWQGVVVETIAFDKRSVTLTSTKSMVVGAATGQLFEAVIEAPGKDKIFQLLHTLEESGQGLGISGLHFEIVGGKKAGNDFSPAATPGSRSGEDADPASSAQASSAGDHPTIFVILSTHTPTRLYHFVGGPTLESLFQNYRELGEDQSFRELPSIGTRGASGLQCAHGSFAMITGAGLYQGSLHFRVGAVRSDSIFGDARLLPYQGGGYMPMAPMTTSGASISAGQSVLIPRALALTRYHALLLFVDRIAVLTRVGAVGNVVQEELIDTAAWGRTLKICVDSENESIWVVTQNALFQVIVVDEDRDVWKLFLEKALDGDDRKFDASFQHCKTQQQRNQVHYVQATYYFKKGQYELAAQFYGKIPGFFEEICLKFIEANADDALKTYLMEKLRRLGPQDKMQQTMIGTWLTEMYAHSSAYKTLDSKATNAFKKFLHDNKEKLNAHVVVNLLSSHGHTDELMKEYASAIEDYELLVSNYLVMQESRKDNYVLKAIEEISKAPFERVENLIYKVAGELISREPGPATVLWMSKPKLDQSRLLPALAHYTKLRAQAIATNTSYMPDGGNILGNMETPDKRAKTGITFNEGQEPEETPQEAFKRKFQEDHAQKYLEHCINMQGCKNTSLHNYLLTLYVQKPASSTEDKDKLIDFIKNPASAFDPNYALRLCTNEERYRACIYLYSKMGLYDEAVELALKVDLNMAKQNASIATDKDLKKHLWLKIAKFVIDQEKDIPKSIKILEESGHLLKIEDILPFFPDFAVIDAFKSEICASLEEYNSTIQGLKGEMEEYTTCAETISKEISELKNHSIFMDPAQPCEICNIPALNAEFYLFPCSHAFHYECLFEEILPNLSDKYREAAKALRMKIDAQQQRIFNENTQRTQVQLKLLQTEFDGYIAAECFLCGNVMIQNIDVPLITDEEKEKEVFLWDISA